MLITNFYDLYKTKSSGISITNDFLKPCQNDSWMYGTEPGFNEILVATTIHKLKRKIYLDKPGI